MRHFRFLTFCRTYLMPGLLAGVVAGFGPMISGCGERQEDGHQGDESAEERRGHCTGIVTEGTTL